MSFADLNPITNAYAAALTDRTLAPELRTALEDAREIVQQAGQTVVVQQGIGPNPFDQAGFNPARDLGPRVWSAVFGGWGAVPFAANGWGWLTVYVLAPLVGGQVGGILYRLFFKPGYVEESK